MSLGIFCASSWLHGDMHGNHAPWLLLRRSESILDFSAKLSDHIRDPEAFDADGCKNKAERKYCECLST